MDKGHIVVTGGEGVLGSYMTMGTRMGRKDLDVTDFNSVMKVCTDLSPQVIIHCAALTDLAVCEKNPDQAFLVNSASSYHLALAARAVGATLVYISTSDVFDGTKEGPYTEHDVPHPVSIYGLSKHLGELSVQQVLPNNSLIVRVSWMFGGGPGKDTKFVGKILAQKDAPEIRAVIDKRGSPTWAKDVANAIELLIQEGAQGIHHIGGGTATRYEMAQEIVTAMGWKTTVIPVDSSGFASVYPITENQSMPLSSRVRPWQEALRAYISAEWGTI